MRVKPYRKVLNDIDMQYLTENLPWRTTEGDDDVHWMRHNLNGYRTCH